MAAPSNLHRRPRHLSQHKVQQKQTQTSRKAGSRTSSPVHGRSTMIVNLATETDVESVHFAQEQGRCPRERCARKVQHDENHRHHTSIYTTCWISAKCCVLSMAFQVVQSNTGPLSPAPSSTVLACAKCYPTEAGPAGGRYHTIHGADRRELPSISFKKRRLTS